MSGATTSMFAPKRIDLRAAFSTTPGPLDFVLPGFLAGTVGTLFSPGATGKSFWALEAAMACAGGGDLLGLGTKFTGRVVYLAAEDPLVVLHKRLHAIGGHLSPAAQDAVADNVDVLGFLGGGLNLGESGQVKDLIEYSHGARLIVIDTISRVHLFDENSNSEMANLLKILEHIAATTGASILFLHHVSKGSVASGAGDQQQAARGASALVDNARWGASLSRMTADESKKYYHPTLPGIIGEDRRSFFVRLSVVKNNYGEPIADRWFMRANEGVLLPVDLQENQAQGPKNPKSKLSVVSRNDQHI